MAKKPLKKVPLTEEKVEVLKLMPEKFSNEQLAGIIEREGLDYALLSYLDVDRDLLDPRTVELCKKIIDAKEELYKYIEYDKVIEGEEETMKKRYGFEELRGEKKEEMHKIMKEHGEIKGSAGGFPLSPMYYEWEGTEEGAEKLKALGVILHDRNS